MQPFSMAVVIPTCRRPELLRRTVASLAECRLPSECRVVAVVENGPKHGAEEVLAEFNGRLPLRYQYEPVANKSHALNQVLETLTEELVVFFDDDVRLHPGVLEAYLATARGKTGGEFYGGPVTGDYEKKIPDWLLGFLPPCTTGWDYGEQQRAREQGSFLGFNWAAFTADLRRVGGFNPNLGPGAPTESLGDENEAQAKLRRGGVVAMYVPAARVWHWIPADRADPRWALRRAYRIGIQDGLEDGTVSVPCLFGYPRWAVREYLESVLEMGISWTRCDPAGRFRPKHKFHRMRGYFKGRRLHRRMQREEHDA